MRLVAFRWLRRRSNSRCTGRLPIPKQVTGSARSRARMLRKSCTLIFLFLLAVSAFSVVAGAYCFTVTVTGAGSPAANGTYEYDGHLTYGRPSYTMISGTFCVWYTGSYWCIQDWYGTGAVYYNNPADTVVPPETGWQVHPLGSAELPAPTLSSSSCSDPTIAADASMGGSITPSGVVTVAEGDDTTFYITPNAGYRIDDVYVDSDPIAPVMTYTFFDVTIPHSIYVMFVVDNPPVLTVPPDVTIDCDESCDPSNTGQATATDDYDPEPVITYADSKYYTGDRSCTERLWTATDDSGNSTSGLQTIWMTAPGATVVSDHPVWVTSLPASVRVDFTIEKYADSAWIWSRCNENWSLHFSSDKAPVIADDSTVNTQFIDLPADAPEGTYQLMWIHIDPPANPCMSGFAKSFGWLLYGIDLSPPVVTGCPPDIAAVAPFGETSVAVDWTEPHFDDAVSGIFSVTSTHDPGDVFEVGTTEVTYTATDNVGRVATCSFNVTVGTVELAEGVLPGDGTGPELILAGATLLDPEDAPMIGGFALAATCGAGGTLTGAFELEGPDGQHLRGSYVTLHLYGVELKDPDGTELTLVDHWVVRYDHTSHQWHFSVATEDLLPGYYYIRLGLPGDASVTLPVEITCP